MAGASPPGSGKRPAVFVFGPGTPRPASTSGEVTNAGNQPNGILNQGKSNGWDMIYIGLYKSDSPNQYDFTYDQVYADYTAAVINDLVAHNNTDPKRIYAYGTSAGGRVPTFMACHLSGSFAAVVAQGGAVHGPAAPANVPVDHCYRPSNPVSTMYVYADKAQVPQGNPVENYAVHNTPSHPTLTSADAADITAVRPAQVYYAMEHVGEAWAFWNGCADNLVGHTAQILTVGVAPNTSPGTKLWQWTGCRDEAGATSGEVDLYIIPGSHGVEPEVQDDGRAYNFLVQHPG